MAIQESGEMYLETILSLKKKKAYVRSIDIVEEMGHSKSSVSKAMSILKNAGFITIGTDGCIEFTSIGLERATAIYERHIVLTQYLESLGVSHLVAEEDACKIEHDISQETFDAIKKQM